MFFFCNSSLMYNVKFCKWVIWKSFVKKVLVCIVATMVLEMFFFFWNRAASPVEVAFQPNFSSHAIKSYGVPKEDDKHDSDVKPSSSSATLPSAAIVPVISSDTALKDVEEVHNRVTRIEQDYFEPWVTRDTQDLKKKSWFSLSSFSLSCVSLCDIRLVLIFMFQDINSYYPTVLPLRKPNSGDPGMLWCESQSSALWMCLISAFDHLFVVLLELLDQEEFGNVAKHLHYDENNINSAEELGLTMVMSL